MVDFNNISGQNKGRLQITKLAKFLGKPESTIRARKNKDSREFNILHLGALCEANGIKEDDIKKIVKFKEDGYCIFIDDITTRPIGYVRDAIIHNLGWCLCNTGQKDITDKIRKIERDFFYLLYGYIKGGFLSPDKLSKILNISFQNKDVFNCASPFVEVVAMQETSKVDVSISPCLITFLSKMIYAVNEIVFFEEFSVFDKFSKTHREARRKSYEGIEVFYTQYFNMFNKNSDYLDVAKRLK